MKTYLNLALTAFLLSGLAGATTLPSQSRSWQPSRVDLYDLDHHRAYSWKISSIVIPTGYRIMGASLFFDNIRNWDSNPNSLYLHLLDTAKGSGVQSFEDNKFDAIMDDNFAGDLYKTNPLVVQPTANTYLWTYYNLPTRPQDLTYQFTSFQLAALRSYISNGADIAFGMDPDCHFYNDGITFTMTTAPVPEPGTAGLCLTAVAALAWRLRKRRPA